MFQTLTAVSRRFLRMEHLKLNNRFYRLLKIDRAGSPRVFYLQICQNRPENCKESQVGVTQFD